MAYDQEEQRRANERHRLRRDRLQQIRNELTDILNDYYENFPESETGESDLERRIEDRLRSVQKGVDGFIREFRNLPNE